MKRAPRTAWPAGRRAALSDPPGAGTSATVVREAIAEVFHLAASVRIRIGYIICEKGEPLCGVLAALQPCLGELFPPSVTCWMCACIAKRDGIAVAGSDAA